MSLKPYLSIVAASRNDDHGGDPLHRTQIFINCFVQQCNRFKLPAELILVDWNPVPDRPGLAAVLRLPEANDYCTGRIITVPAELHDTIKYGDRLAFFQMIAKNVGIRRARGAFVLATNIDIVFSNELVAFLAEQKLDPGRMYRVDRFDFKTDLPVNAGVGVVIDRAWESIIRTNRRANLQEVLDPLYGHDPACRDCRPHIPPEGIQSNKITLVEEDGQWQLRPHPESPIEHLNTNACGDFTLLAKEAWGAIGGYPEFEAFSFNIDSMGVVAAHYHGYHETSLLPPCVCFHIEHGLGSGYTPEGEQTLFDRLRAKRILSPDWPVLNPWVAQMRADQTAIQFNRSDWGLAEYTLPEQPFGDKDRPGPHSPARVAGSAGALRPQYDLDSVTLFHERELQHQQSRQQPAAAAAPVVVPAPAAPPTLVVVPVVAPRAAAAAVAAVPLPDSAPTAPRSAPVQVASVAQPPASVPVAVHGDPFEHSHDGYTLREHYAAQHGSAGKPILLCAPQSQIESLTSLLKSFTHRAVLSAAVRKGAKIDDGDVLMVAADPRQLIQDLHRGGLLVPGNRDAEVAIWVQSDQTQRAAWSPAINLARRLLAAAGWRVKAASLSTLG